MSIEHPQEKSNSNLPEPVSSKHLTLIEVLILKRGEGGTITIHTTPFKSQIHNLYNNFPQFNASVSLEYDAITCSFKHGNLHLLIAHLERNGFVSKKTRIPKSKKKRIYRSYMRGSQIIDVLHLPAHSGESNPYPDFIRDTLKFYAPSDELIRLMLKPFGRDDQPKLSKLEFPFDFRSDSKRTAQLVQKHLESVLHPHFSRSKAYYVTKKSGRLARRVSDALHTFYPSKGLKIYVRPETPTITRLELTVTRRELLKHGLAHLSDLLGPVSLDFQQYFTFSQLDSDGLVKYLAKRWYKSHRDAYKLTMASTKRGFFGDKESDLWLGYARDWLDLFPSLASVLVELKKDKISAKKFLIPYTE